MGERGNHKCLGHLASQALADQVEEDSERWREDCLYGSQVLPFREITFFWITKEIKDIAAYYGLPFLFLDCVFTDFILTESRGG